jgi:hypothetical protein
MFVDLVLSWKPNAKLISIMTEPKDGSNKWQCFSQYYIVDFCKKKKKYHQASAKLSFQNASGS